MRKSLAEIEEIDRYIFHELSPADRLVFQARLILSPSLRENLRYQRRVHQWVRQVARMRQKEQLEAVYRLLLQDEHFQLQITSLFKDQ